MPPDIHDAWLQWGSELKLLSDKHLPRCSFPDAVSIVAVELHGFCDASERAYAGVVYLGMINSTGDVHLSIVASKTKVAPIKRLTIPRLELCSARLLTQLLHHIQHVFNLPLNCVYTWTDSTIILSWLVGNSRRFKAFVGNRILHIVELISPDRWRHVNGTDNPADCASRGLFPSELLDHDLWWNGLEWLKLPYTDWPKPSTIPDVGPSDEEREVYVHTTLHQKTPLIPLDRFSNITPFMYITAWILRFVNNCRARDGLQTSKVRSPLSVQGLSSAENYWLRLSQEEHFTEDIQSLKTGHALTKSSCLLPLSPVLNHSGVLRVGGRVQNARLCYSVHHPAILHSKHRITKLIMYLEHLRLLHAGPTLITASLSHRYHVIGSRKTMYSVTRGCIVCRRISARPQPQMLGQLPTERLTPGLVFDHVGVNYAGPSTSSMVLSVNLPSSRRTFVSSFLCLSKLFSWSSSLISLQRHSLLHSDVSSLVAVDRLQSGVTMAPTSLALLKRSSNSFDSWRGEKHKELFQSSVLHRISSGNLFQSVLLTSAVSGKQLSRV